MNQRDQLCGRCRPRDDKAIVGDDDEIIDKRAINDQRRMSSGDGQRG